MSVPLTGKNLRNYLKGFVLQALPYYHRQAVQAHQPNHTLCSHAVEGMYLPL